MICTQNEAPQLGFLFLLLPSKQYDTSTEFIKKICIRNFDREEAKSWHSVLNKISI
jgi:hypothetical protein